MNNFRWNIQKERCHFDFDHWFTFAFVQFQLKISYASVGSIFVKFFFASSKHLKWNVFKLETLSSDSVQQIFVVWCLMLTIGVHMRKFVSQPHYSTWTETERRHIQHNIFFFAIFFSLHVNGFLVVSHSYQPMPMHE